MTDRDARGLFQPGNKLAAGRRPRRDGLNLARWFREALSDPTRREKLLARIDRELDAVTRHLVLLAALVENLARSVRSRQDAPEPEDDAPAVPTSGLPVCTCPPCLAERASGRRP